MFLKQKILRYIQWSVSEQKKMPVQYNISLWCLEHNNEINVLISTYLFNNCHICLVFFRYIFLICFWEGLQKGPLHWRLYIRWKITHKIETSMLFFLKQILKICSIWSINLWIKNNSPCFWIIILSILSKYVK